MKQVGHEETLKVSYYQIDGKQTMTPAALLSDLQEAAINHSDALGYTVPYLQERQWGWAVINWHLQMERMPRLGERFTLQTWSDKCRRMQATRSFLLLDEEGNLIMKGASRWIFMDLEKRKPTNIPDEMIEAYHSGKEAALENEKFLMPKVADGDGEPVTRSFVITRRDTDTNGHANNVKYLEWAMDDIPDAIYDHMALKDMRIVYRKECVRGDAVTIETFLREKEEKKEVLTFITNGAGGVFAEIATLWDAVGENKE